MTNGTGMFLSAIGKSICSTDGLCIVLHNIQVMFYSKLHDRLHITRLTEKMYRDNSLCLRA